MMKIFTFLNDKLVIIKNILIIISIVATIAGTGYGVYKAYHTGFDQGVATQKIADQKVLDQQQVEIVALQKQLFKVSDMLSTKSIAYEQAQTAQNELERKLIDAVNKNSNGSSCNISDSWMQQLTTTFDASASQFPRQ